MVIRAARLDGIGPMTPDAELTTPFPGDAR